jgi:hypothetical protein
MVFLRRKVSLFDKKDIAAELPNEKVRSEISRNSSRIGPRLDVGAFCFSAK